MQSTFERFAQTRVYRLLFALALTLACLYAAMVAVDGIKYVGLRPALLGFTLRLLKADVIDAISVQSYHLLGFGFGDAARPTRYALICEDAQTPEQDNIIAERQLRSQLVENKGGIAYNNMRAAMEKGQQQPVFVLMRNGPGAARFCAASAYSHQECTCGGRYNARERARIPAQDLFSPASWQK
jgi:hypothetical protein